MEGARVGSWLLGKPIGSGGIAAVFEATHTDGRRGAVKVLHPASIGTAQVKRFQREFQALSRLDHPNIVRVYETGLVNEFPWIAMELVEGTDLQAVLNEWKDHSPKERWSRVFEILRGLCSALTYIHDKGLIHRDLKPSNVLIGRDGEAKLTDFGVVKDSSSNTTGLTQMGDLIGTVAFMAPEQILDEPIDARTDLYALGALLYVMLTDDRPIEADSISGFLAKHIAHVPPAPSEIRDDIPPILEMVCQRLLFKDRNHRFASAEAVIAALDDASESEMLPLRGREEVVERWQERLSRLADGHGGIVCLSGPRWSGLNFTLSHLLHGTDILFAETDGRSRNPITELLKQAGGDPSAPTKLHLRHLADCLRKQPTILVVHDLHLVDPRIVDALSRLMRKLVVLEDVPTLLVYSCASHRVEELQSVLFAGASWADHFTHWSLPPLGRRSLAQITRDRKLKGGFVGVLVRRLTEELMGRPGAAALQLTALVQAGWIQRDGDRLKASKPAHTFSNDPLPIPAEARRIIKAILTNLTPESTSILEVLSTIGEPAPWDLIQQIADVPHGERDILRQDGILVQLDDHEGQPALAFALPWIERLVYEAIPESRSIELHLAVAELLSRANRRHQLARVARHFERGAKPDRAWPIYVRAGRLSAKEGKHLNAISALKAARRVEQQGLATAGAHEGAKTLMLARMTEGEAYTGRGAWQSALSPLSDASKLARNLNAERALAEIQGIEGRAWYRLGRLDEARPRLESAVAGAKRGDAIQESAIRLLADIQLQMGSTQASEQLWKDAVAIARTSSASDSEARALRGLAHVRALEGRLQASWELLLRAEELLGSDCDPRVRAGILARSTELALAAGRYSEAFRRSDDLLLLIERRDLESRELEAICLRANVLLALGKPQDANQFVVQAERLAYASPPEVKIRIAGLRARIGPPEEALVLLPREEDVAPDSIGDVAGQYQAVRARAMALSDADQAIQLGQAVLKREPARLMLRLADIHRDVGEAFLDAGRTTLARRAAKSALRRTSTRGANGLRLELLSVFHRADPDPRILAAFRQIAKQVLEVETPEVHRAVMARPEFQAAFKDRL